MTCFKVQHKDFYSKTRCFRNTTSPYLSFFSLVLPFILFLEPTTKPNTLCNTPDAQYWNQFDSQWLLVWMDCVLLGHSANYMMDC